MNGVYTPVKTDNFTCYTPLGKSVVDYLICSKEMSKKLQHFEILPKLVESDHTPLSFEIGLSNRIGRVDPGQGGPERRVGSQTDKTFKIWQEDSNKS